MRDQITLGAAALGLTILAWVYLVKTSTAMNGMAMDAAAMPGMQMWSAPDIWMLFVMWSVMMIGMMLPSAAPVLIVAVGTYRHRHGRSLTLEAAAFLCGYLIAWIGFSAITALAQAGFHRAAVLSPMMVTSSAVVGGIILIVAGIYQFSAFKRACLAHCRTPLGFFTSEWREGVRGALVMGVHHGRFCVGCCWALMAVLFVAGVMNLLWVAAIALLVLAEKLLPIGPAISRWSGGLLIVWGFVLVVRGL
jgi:predicted metal-binding membrane protein